MVASLGFIFLVGLVCARLCTKIKLPPIVGMLFAGVILGPYVFNMLDPKILEVSGDLRQIALIIILLKAGLSLNLEDLKQVGRPAMLLSFVPATCEIIGVALLAPILLDITIIEALVVGSVLAAVSPAVIVPKMVFFMETGYGTKKKIPQMILAGASLDDIFVIVLFTTFTSLALGGEISSLSFLDIPISIISGVVVGIMVGLALEKGFHHMEEKNQEIKNSIKIIVILGFAFFLVTLEQWLVVHLPLSGLLAVMSMAMTLSKQGNKETTKQVSESFSGLWSGAEVLLFVLVGAAVDIPYATGAGIGVIILIFSVLVFRMMGVYLSLMGTNLNTKEKLFSMIAYMPKATVQAAIGGVPLAMGLPCGSLVLTVAVVAILITAPLGAMGIDTTYKKCLEKE